VSVAVVLALTMTTSCLFEQSTEIAASLITVSVLLAVAATSTSIAALAAWALALLVRGSLYVDVLTSLGDVRICASVNHNHLLFPEKIF